MATATDDPNIDQLVAWYTAADDDQRRTWVGQLTSEAHIAVARQVITAYEQGTADWRQNPTTMAHHLTGGTLRQWRYSMLLGEKFKDAVEGRSIRQIWCLPPRYGKSVIASQWGPTWALDRNPAYKMILVSYGDTLAVSNATVARDNLREHRDELRAQLRADRRSAGLFATTAGGQVLARGINSGIIGMGAHGIVFDDPFKNWIEAHSAARRQSVDDAFRSVVSSRLDFADSWVIVVMTRWHEDDLVGRLMQRGAAGTGEQWELIRMAEVADEYDPGSLDQYKRMVDPLGRAAGELLEPERFDRATITAKHLAAGSYLMAGMYQQRPAPEEGGEIRRAWFVDALVETLPDRYDDVVSSWDMKLKDKESGDYVVGQMWGRTGKDFWLIDQLRGQWNQATTENAIALMTVRHPEIRRHYIENTGNGPEVMTSLRATKPGYEVSDDVAGALGMVGDEQARVSALRQRGLGQLLPVVVKGDKSVRMRVHSGKAEAGDVHLRTGWAGLGPFLDEVSAFPDGAHDDQVDAMSQALSKLAGGEASAKAPAGTLPKAQINTRTGTGGTMQTAQPRRRRTRSAQIMVPRTTGTGR